ncbi:Nucleoporin [Trypanosoma equiperdum]|uniref:Nuclear pore complex protein n=1 Tax=Trypanosoma equiperdum TaxID=5694 RepID=A0A1G4IID9_TRYEQ|nr:Nucleoporin [Trypanosoma equiperdum]
MLTTFEQQHGMVELPPLGEKVSIYDRGSIFAVHDNWLDTGAANDTNSTSAHPSRAFAEVYLGSVVRSVFTADQFMRWSKRDNRVEESNLWSLLLELLLDAEQAVKYNPDAIGIAKVQPHRQWYVSHQAHIQDLLQRQPLLRRMNIIIRWLERVYRTGNAPLKLASSRTPEEAVLLRQIVLSCLRGGELHRAIDLSVTAKDCMYSCLLSAAQMQTVAEPWFNATPLVPLFGEYGNGEVDLEWACNEHRLDNLSQLYEDSVALSTSSEGQTAGGGLDGLIAAVLCGNLDVMEPAFATGNWKDVVWCHLRSALVLCFTKTLMAARHNVQAPYGALVERLTGSHDSWQDETAQSVVRRLADRLESSYFATVSFEEKLQMRVILHFLSSDNADWTNVLNDLSRVKGVAQSDPNGIRLVSHLLLCLDTAYSEALHSRSVQVYSTSLAEALTRYAESLVQLPHYAPQDAMRAVIAMNLRLRDARQRASVYAAFLVACRCRELQLTKREEVEALEEKLVQMFCKADPVSEVHDEVMRLLNQKVEPATLLTHNPLAEAVMWRAMHADSPDDFIVALRHSLEACGSFWLAEPRAELDAITDVAGIIRRTILPNLRRDSIALSATPTEMELAESHFWMTFAALRTAADQHAKTTARLDLALGGTDRTLEFQLVQDEAALMRELHSLARKALTYGGAVVHRSRSCVTAVTWLLQVFVEEVVLSVRLAASRSSVIVEYLRHVFELIEQINDSGYVEPSLMPQQSARDLFAAVRSLRMACGQKAHDLLVEEAKKVAVTQQQLFVTSQPKW